jgi:hypothetical protein
MNVNELAEKVRDRVDLHYSQKVHPDRRHLHDMAVGVAGVLGMPADFHNTGHLMGLLAAHTEAPVYPKMKFRGTEHRIVRSEEEERDLGDAWTDERAGGAQ